MYEGLLLTAVVWLYFWGVLMTFIMFTLSHKGSFTTFHALIVFPMCISWPLFQPYIILRSFWDAATTIRKARQKQHMKGTK